MVDGSVESADPAKAAEVRSIIRTAMETYKLRAVIVRVTIDGEDVITEAFGNSMTGIPASTDMHFRNGSVAEFYIANLLLQMVDQKQISLDDKHPAEPALLPGLHLLGHVMEPGQGRHPDDEHL